MINKFPPLKDPLVSVVMTARNTANFIDQAINSILNQTYTHLELLIVDDASTDNTLEHIEAVADSRVRKFQNPHQLHYLHSCNRMMANCKGQLITFQDSDDWSHPDRIRMQVESLAANTDLGGNSVNFVKMDMMGTQELMRSNYPTTHQEIFDTIPNDFPVLAGAIMIRKEVYDAIGPYNSFFDRAGSEHLYWLYIIMERFQFVNLPEHLYYYRQNTDSFTGKISEYDYSRWIAKEALTFIVNQRRATGTDAIQFNNLQQIYLMLKKIEKEQLYRVSLAQNLSWSGNYHRALRELLLAIRKNPSLLFANLKDLLFYIRRANRS